MYIYVYVYIYIYIYLKVASNLNKMYYIYVESLIKCYYEVAEKGL